MGPAGVPYMSLERKMRARLMQVFLMKMSYFFAIIFILN